MALIYKAQLTPTRMELLAAWVPAQPWLGDVDACALEAVGAYRFDDPAGEVGIETHLLRAADGQILQVPVTYRGVPADGAEPSLIGTARHSVLGQRWVYDGCADPVYVQALATAILTGGTQAEVEIATGTATVHREVTTRVSGSGTAGTAVPRVGPVTCINDGPTTVIDAGELELVVLRTIDSAVRAAGDTLLGTWPGRDVPALLALARAG